MADEELERDDGGAEESGGGEAKPPKGRLKTILIALAVAGLLASNVFFILRVTGSETHPATEAASSEEEAASEDSGEGVPDLLESASVLPLEPLLVNLADGEANRFVRARVELVFETTEEMERIKESPFAVAKAQDVALSLLSAKRAADLADNDGRARFREELGAAIENSLPGVEVVDVLLTDFIIQY